MMAFSAVMNLFVSRLLLRVARETDSRALEVEGYNLRTDVRGRLWGSSAHKIPDGLEERIRGNLPNSDVLITSRTTAASEARSSRRLEEWRTHVESLSSPNTVS